MQLEFTFSRTEATIGGDAVPVDDNYLTNDNVFVAPRYAQPSEPKTGLLVGFQGEAGAGPIGVDVYFYDAASGLWFLFGHDSIELGEVCYIQFPTTIDRSTDRQFQKVPVAIVTTAPDPVPEGDYTIYASSVVAGADEGTQLEDAAHVTGDVGVMSLAVRNDVLASLVSADGDYAPIQVDASGAVYVTSVPGAPVVVQGMAPDDDPIAGNPVQIGGYYLEDEAANPIDDGDVGYVAINSLRQMRADLATKLAGEDMYLDVMHVADDGPSYLITAAGTYVVKAGSGILKRLIFLNVSAAASTITIYDNTAGSGTVIMPTANMTTTELPANAPHEVECGIDFTVGLTIVVTGATNVIAVYE